MTNEQVKFYKTSKHRREYERRYHKENPGMITHRQLARKVYPVRQTCQVKGCNELGERHHEDWRKPLEITWLCQKHHAEWHDSLQTYGEIKEYGKFTLEEFLQEVSHEEWLEKRRRQQLADLTLIYEDKEYEPNEEVNDEQSTA